MPIEFPVPANSGPQPFATGITVSHQALHLVLADGREITVPVARFPRLHRAAPAEFANWRMIGGGIGIHWPELDENISTESLLSTPQTVGPRPIYPFSVNWPTRATRRACPQQPKNASKSDRQGVAAPVRRRGHSARAGSSNPGPHDGRRHSRYSSSWQLASAPPRWT